MNANWSCSESVATALHLAANGRQPRQHPQRPQSLSPKQVMQLPQNFSHRSASEPVQLMFAAHLEKALTQVLYTHSLQADVHLLSSSPSSPSSPAPTPPSPVPWMQPTHCWQLLSHLLNSAVLQAGSSTTGAGSSGQLWPSASALSAATSPNEDT